MDPPNNKLQPEEQQEDEESLDAHLENWHKLLSSENAPISTKRRKTNTIEHQNTRIVRSTGRKDRHSKVYTSRGPKDRRLRLSPRTAIQFYDVQDRLGCDRPSKAIDWLMKEAKIAIDGLDVQNVKNNPTSSSSVFANGNVPIQDSLLSHIFDDDDVEIDRLQRIFNWNYANEIENSVFINDSQISNEFPGVNFYGEELSNFTATVKDDEK